MHGTLRTDYFSAELWLCCLGVVAELKALPHDVLVGLGEGDVSQRRDHARL